MKIEKYRIEEHNHSLIKDHQRRLDFLSGEINDSNAIVQKLVEFQVAIPSWALGTGGTRFGRFGGGGEVTKFVCGYLACDPRLSEVFLAGLPPIFKVHLVKDASDQWLENSIRFSSH